MSIKENTFAEACYNQNSITDLEQALSRGPDQVDMKTWRLTAEQWREQIELAIKAKREDEEQAR